MKAVISTLDNSGFVSALTDLREGLSSLCPPPRDAMDAVHEISREVRREFGGTGGIREHFGLSSGSTGVPTLERYLEALESQVQDLMTTRGAKWGVRSEPVSSWVQRYIESHYDEPVTLKSVAQIVNLNPAYLGQRFRDETGMSFHDALLRVRMHVAADALRTTSTPIHTIAKQVGYQAPVNFYKGFRRVHETSPAEYRKRFTGNEE
jgi:two-component system response regulator YesN